MPASLPVSLSVLVISYVTNVFGFFKKLSNKWPDYLQFLIEVKNWKLVIAP